MGKMYLCCWVLLESSFPGIRGTLYSRCGRKQYLGALLPLLWTPSVMLRNSMPQLPDDSGLPPGWAMKLGGEYKKRYS